MIMRSLPLILGSLLAVLLLTGCSESEDTFSLEGKASKEKPAVDKWLFRHPDARIYVTRIDNCQYLMSETKGAYWVASHKGDCDNSIHVYNKINN